MRWLKHIGWTFGKTTFLFLFASLFASISLFNSEEHFSSFSRDFFYRVFAPFYPGSSDRAATVVLLNDASFRNFDTYPVKYQTHATILRALASYNPRAVFIDFAFIDNRPDSTIEELKRAIEDYHTRNIRVYVPAHRTTTAANDRGIRPDLANLADSGRIRLVSFELGRTLWGTPIYNLRSAREDLLTASVQIAKDYLPNRYENIKHRSEFEIWWGLPPAHINCTRNNVPCPWNYTLVETLWGSKYSFLARLRDSIDFQFGPTATYSKPDSVDVPYSPVVYVEELLSGNARKLIEPALHNKFIFYGADLDITRDNFPNPLFSYRSEDRVLPGVFFHAMALENIHDLKEHIKTPRQRDPRAMWARDVISIGLICLALFVWRVFTSFNSRLLDAGIIVAASVAIALFEFFVLDHAPSNWIGVFSFAILARLTPSDALFETVVSKISSTWQLGRSGVTPP